MTVQVNIHEAKTHLSQLVDQAAAGEDVIMAQARCEGLTLVTGDQHIAKYDVPLLLC